MRLQHIIEQVYLKAWLITPSAHASIRKLIEAKILDQNASSFEDWYVQRKPLSIDSKGIAHIDIRGVIGQGLSKIEKTCGATDTLDVADDIDAAQNARAKGYLFHIDSPGGTVTGTPELADKIAEITEPKASVTNSMIASAAYWLAAGTDKIFATKSADIGSIGVYMPWVDSSAVYEMMGLKPDPIVNEGGDLKAIGFGGSLTPQQRTYLQDEVNQAFADFKNHVLSFRAIEDSAMRGQTLIGKKALEANLIDELGDESAAIEWLTGLSLSNGKRI